jgi:hypothetical protein
METVTVTCEVPTHIRDLVVFAKSVVKRNAILPMTDEEMIFAARDFWESEHGEE